MPLYEYLCNDCGREFEKMLRFSEAGQKPACPACQSQDTTKKISSFASPGGAASGIATGGCNPGSRFS